jgi:hypothetical protein
MDPLLRAKEVAVDACDTNSPTVTLIRAVKLVKSEGSLFGEIFET